MCSLHSHEENSAKPSLSQMSRHRSSVTASPYHWWASSWARVSSSGGRSKIGLVWVSSAYPTSFAGSTIAPAEENG